LRKLRSRRSAAAVSTVDRIPGGAVSVLRLGAQKGLEAHTNQLRIADLDRNLIDDWLGMVGKSRRVRTGFWDALIRGN
jgi:hypothetical protein